MSTTLHQTPTHPSAPPPPRRRRVALFAAGAVLVAALGSGGALALGDRNDHQSAAATQSSAVAAQPAANLQSAQPAGQSAKPAAPTPANHNTSGQQRGSDNKQTSGRLHREGVVTLADGRYDSYVRKVDPDRDLIVVDLVQVFTGDAAVRAAIEDGMDRQAAEVRDTYVRNQNPRLRTLEMASNVQLRLIGSCESTGQEALFTKLIKDATYGQGQLFYYTLHVQGGVVRQIDEHLAQPAC